MGFETLIQAGVTLANGLTSSLQSTVTHQTIASLSGDGLPTYTSTSRTAIVIKKNKVVRNFRGETVVSHTQLIFPKTVTVLETDIFTLPDGTSPRIMQVSGVVDPTTNAEYMVEVSLG